MVNVSTASNRAAGDTSTGHAASAKAQDAARQRTQTQLEYTGDMSMLRAIRFGRWGLAENPIDQIIVTSAGQLYEVTGAYRREFPQAFMLTTRHFNREPGPDIAASAVKLVLPDAADYTNGDE